MAELPSPTKVSGKHNAIYEAYYSKINAKGAETIGAKQAADFLKKSGLSDVVLSRIWDLSDPNGHGCLDKTGFFVALKLISLAQHGYDINMRNILMETQNPPKVGDIPKIIPQRIQSVSTSNTDWSMKPKDKLKYEELFETLRPVNGLIAGNKVRGVLMDSKLPVDTLGKIWDLADEDKDGNLDRHEFTVAMHLVYQALDKRAVPTTLPPELRKRSPKQSIPKAPSGENFGSSNFVANFPKDIAPPPSVPLVPIQSSMPQSSVLQNSMLQSSILPPGAFSMPLLPSTTTSDSLEWIVTPIEKLRYEEIFRDCDKDKDGLVCGLEIKDVFLKSGVQQNCLAHIWALCDTNQSGKLNVEQFALAMWLVEQKKKGIEPPEVLAPNMIPPSLRRAGAGIEPLVPAEPRYKYSNPELEMISKEIDELLKERRVLETDIAQKDADIRIKTGEIRSLQSELDTLSATLKQLENQKGEAQKRLDDLINQVSKIRDQCQKQGETISEQESELNSKRSELQKLKDEESSLEKEYEALRKEIESLSQQSQDKQLQISQVKAMVTQLLESQRQMNDAMLLCRAALEANDSYLVSDYSLKIEPDFREAKDTLLRLNEPPKSHSLNESNNDGFGEKTFDANHFSSDPFGSTTNNNMKTGFDDSFSAPPLTGFDDAFGASFTNQTKDSFNLNADPFGDKQSKAGMATSIEAGKDNFGSDPFAILHAPTSGGQVLSANSSKSGPPPRPESPSPALPPKKSKQPPPRPAPPRPLQGPSRPAPPASTGMDSFSSSGGFADFADFDNKQSILSSSLSYSSTIESTLKMDQNNHNNQSIDGGGGDSSGYHSKIVKNTIANVTSIQQSLLNHSSNIERRPITPPTTTVLTFNQPKPPIFSIPIAKTPKTKFLSSTNKSNKTNSDNSNITSSDSSATTVTTTTAVTTVKDFVDDPFKDYRYEDPFNIKDPFIDDNDNKDEYDVFQKDENSNKFQPAHSIMKDVKDDDFSLFKFDDSFYKLQPNTKNNNVKSKNEDSAFDAFGTLKSSLNNNKNNNNLLNIKKSNGKQQFDDFSDDSFEDGFSGLQLNYDELKNSNIILSATETAKTTVTTSNFNDKFELNENFASFDDFVINNNDNNNSFGNTDEEKSFKKPITDKKKTLNEKISKTFADDYSKSNNFDDDLKAAIERSLIEQ